jgi:rubrerythrin
MKKNDNEIIMVPPGATLTAVSSWQWWIDAAGKEHFRQSWRCEKCRVEVHDRRCPHCGKTKREKA